jgi:hypothetical protein
MCKQESFLRSLARNGTGSYQRSRGSRNIVCLVVASALALAVSVHTSELFAADEIQQIKLGPHIFYVPEAWMTGAGVTAFIRPQGMVEKPQSTVIEADSLSFRPSDNWQPYPKHELPDFIHVSYMPWRQLVQTSGPIKTADRQLQKWMAEAARSTPDQDGFVRVEAYGVFLYKASLNSLLGPLVVASNNVDLTPGRRLPSTVSFVTNSHIGGQYRFDNTKFPESTWWELYEHVLAFVDYLQKPK